MAKNYEFDVFISHAVEDKIDIVHELVAKLKESGIEVWYSSDRLRVGRGVEETIKEGLNKSRHGIVVLTHNYFMKDWPKKEFHALWVQEGKRILPVLHKITKEEIEKYDAHLADYWALDTKKGVDFVVRKLVKAIRDNEKPPVSEDEGDEVPVSSSGSKLKLYSVSVMILLVAAFTIWFFLIRDLPSNNLIYTTIKDRINTFQKKIMTAHQLEMNERKGKAATIDEISAYYKRYNDLSAQYRNEYYFNTGYNEYNFKKNVEPALGKEIDLLTPANSYGFQYPNIFAIDYLPSAHTMDVKYIFINTQQPEFKIVEEEKVDDTTYLVEVSYQNHIRYLSVDLTYSKRSDWKKRRQTSFQGFLPLETYQFKKQDDDWVFVGLE